MAIATLFGEEESGDQGVVGLLGEKIHQNKLSYLQLINKFFLIIYMLVWIPFIYKVLFEMISLLFSYAVIILLYFLIIATIYSD